MGGAAGLVLGLNLFVVFQFLGRIGKTCRDRVAYIMGTRKELVQIIIRRTFLGEQFVGAWLALNEFYLNNSQPKEVIVYVMFVAVLIIVLTLFYNGNLKPGYLFSTQSVSTIMGFMTDPSKHFLFWNYWNSNFGLTSLGSFIRSLEIA